MAGPNGNAENLGASRQTRYVENGRAASPVKQIRAEKEKEAPTRSDEVSGLKDYQLGDCLGKGAFGSVYRALNWGTGETVAIKQIKLVDLPKNELRVIMLEIDLLKNLKHANIVKYHGFVKSPDNLYIILEYCENGSLHSICKNFGKFPENLVALYMSQVLHGLLYLHEQGVIHRDIKGANILTTKEGTVKLADFGVATKASGLRESSVVGTPYWMAPEVIELAGATTASDIWSLGCTVIELLDGKPPYYKLQPMPALFRIVNDDHPPLPESISPTVQDFLMQCFQKNPNLRVTAKKLLTHPWILNARRTDAVVPIKPTKYDEAVKSVQQWNEALKAPDNGTVRNESRGASASPVPPPRAEPFPKLTTTGQSVPIPYRERPSHLSGVASIDTYGVPNDEPEDYDDDFASSISPSALQLPQLRPKDNFAGMLSSDKLKAYANNQMPNGPGTIDTLNSSKLDDLFDPNETVRPPSPIKANKQNRNARIMYRKLSQPNTQVLRDSPTHLQAPFRPPQVKRTSSAFRENENIADDYSELVLDDDVALDQRLHQVMHSKQTEAFSPKFEHVSDLKGTPSAARRVKTGGSWRSQRRPSEIVDAAVDEFEDEDRTVRRPKSAQGIQKYMDGVEDEDFSDIFGLDERAKARSNAGSQRGMLKMLHPRRSTTSWLEDEEEDDEDDPFAELEENLDEMDLETKVARDKHARLCSLVEGLVGSLKTTLSEDDLADISEQLMQVLFESPDMKSIVVSSHGLLPLLEVLDNCSQREIILRLLKIVNAIILDSVEIQETLCFVGGIPIVTKFAHKRYSSEIRLEAAAFVRQMYQTSTLTLQMFISCGGLNVLVEFLEEDYDTERDLVLIGVNGVWSVFELQGPTPKNDFCRIFSRRSALWPLSLVLNRVLDEEGELAELVEARIVNIFFLFSQAENHVKESVADRMVLKRVLKDLRRMSPQHQITMLKFVKNLSMLATTLDSLQNSNAIEVLTDLLSSSMKVTHFREMSNQILNIMYNLCRLSKTRQEDAALNGIIPLLQRIVQTERPLKEFALPILCDMAHSGKVARTILWQNKGLAFYVSLLADPYWQVTALDAIFIWLQEETAKVEEHLLDGTFSRGIIECFVSSKADAFENLLEPLQKLLRLSPPVAATLAHPELFSRTVRKLDNKKAVVRGNLLRIIKSICEAVEDQGALLKKYGLYDAIERLSEGDSAILVRNMAADLIRESQLNSNFRSSGDSSRFRPLRRSSSSTKSQTSLYTSNNSPQPMSPLHFRQQSQSTYFESSMDHNVGRPRIARNAPSTTGSFSSLRPPSIDERPPSSGASASNAALASPKGLGIKSRLPRTSLARRLTTSRREENNRPTATPPPPVPALPGLAQRPARMVQVPRRRRPLSDEMSVEE